VTVLYFADTRFPIERANGAQTMATCHALAARGHQVTLVVRPDTSAPARDPFEFYGFPPEPRLSILAIPASAAGPARRVRFLLSAARIAATADAVVYTRDLGLAAFLLQFPRMRRPRVVYESHGIASVVSEELPRLLGNTALTPSRAKLARLERRDRRVWQRAKAYVTITRALADELAARFGPRDDVFVAPDGASEATRDVTPQVGPPDTSDLVVGYAGHLYPWKGVDVLIRALALVPSARGIVIGGHPKETDLARITALVRELRLEDRVELTGLVAPTAVATLLSRATVLALPNTSSAISDRYTSPLKLFEYLALGRAIVASNLPALREVLTDGRTALLVAPGDPAALAGALRRLAADRMLVRSLAAEARALAPSYTWRARAGRIEPALLAAAAE
jgi:glycosyltransferase involved in cell wall biosynthesis